jgi:mono/diheme cytochrome c family protein
LHFQAGDFQPDSRKSAAYNRGAYLATALAHCGECHTPRGLTGGLRDGMALAGTVDGPEGELAPNVTPHPDTGIGKWSRGDLVTLLKSGQKPDFDNLQGVMQEAIDHGFKYLTDVDLDAIATYVMEQPPIANKVARPPR